LSFDVFHHEFLFTLLEKRLDGHTQKDELCHGFDLLEDFSEHRKRLHVQKYNARYFFTLIARQKSLQRLWQVNYRWLVYNLLNSHPQKRLYGLVGALFAQNDCEFDAGLPFLKALDHTGLLTFHKTVLNWWLDRLLGDRLSFDCELEGGGVRDDLDLASHHVR